MEQRGEEAPCEMTQERAKHEKEMEAREKREKRVKQAARKIAAVIVEEGISMFDFDWATREAQGFLVFTLAESDS